MNYIRDSRPSHFIQSCFSRSGVRTIRSKLSWTITTEELWEGTTRMTPELIIFPMSPRQSGWGTEQRITTVWPWEVRVSPFLGWRWRGSLTALVISATFNRSISTATLEKSSVMVTTGEKRIFVRSIFMESYISKVVLWFSLCRNQEKTHPLRCKLEQ